MHAAPTHMQCTMQLDPSTIRFHQPLAPFVMCRLGARSEYSCPPPMAVPRGNEGGTGKRLIDGDLLIRQEMWQRGVA